MYVMRALVGIDRFKVLRVAHYVVFLANAIAAMHIASGAGNVESFAAIVALDDGNHLGCEGTLIHQTADLQRTL